MLTHHQHLNILLRFAPTITEWNKAKRAETKAASDAFDKLLIDSTTQGMWPNKDFNDFEMWKTLDSPVRPASP